MDRKLLVVLSAVVLISLLLLFTMTAALFLLLPNEVGSVAIIELSGTIDYEASLFGGSVITPAIAKRLADQAASDPSVKAVVLVINSPGGTAAAFEVYEILKGLAEKKTTVAFISGYGASGGYLISLPAKEIIASPMALVGSVGAVAIIMSYKGLLDKIGINATTIASGDLKDIGNPYREIEQRDIESIKKLVNDVARDFASKVERHRGEKIRDWREVLRAGVYSGKDAVALGLVDSVGSLEDAIKRAREMAGLPESAPVKRISYQPSIFELLGLKAPKLKREAMTVEILLMWPIPALSGIIVHSDLQRE